MNNEDIQEVVKYLRDQEPSDEELDLYQLELFLRFFEELGIYMKTNSLDTKRIDDFFGYYLRQLYKTKRGVALIKRFNEGGKGDKELTFLQVVIEMLNKHKPFDNLTKK